MRYWLVHEQERREVAARLPSLVKGHSWTERAEVIERDLLQVGATLVPQAVGGFR